MNQFDTDVARARVLINSNGVNQTVLNSGYDPYVIAAALAELSAVWDDVATQHEVKVSE